jgi:hypothetical protein
MTSLIVLFLFFQAGVRNDVFELRQYLGKTYPATIQTLDAKNQILLRNTEKLAPAQAAEMRARMQAPAKLSTERPVLNAKIDNFGQGLLSFLFEDDFIVEHVNFVFCAVRPDDVDRVFAVQMLFDDGRSLGSAPDLLQKVYQLPPPIPRGAKYELALNYPIRPNLPLILWDMGNVEAVYQPVTGERLITGQLWLTDKTVFAACSQVPKLPTAP